MKSENEFTEITITNINISHVNDEFINLSNKIDELKESMNNKNDNIKNNDENIFMKLSVKDISIFDKIEQIINSFENTSLRIIDSDIIIKTDSFRANTENKISFKNPNYKKLYWFIRNSLIREIYKYSLQLYNNTSNISISLGKIEYNPKDIPTKIKNIKLFEDSLDKNF